MLPDLISGKMDEEKSYDKSLGQVLTPPEIVDYMVEESIKARLADKKDDKPLSILDPACGTGRFILGVADYCWKNNVDFVMWNIDVDEKMFDACKFHALHYKIPAVVILGDALLCDFKRAVKCAGGVEEELDVEAITEMFQELTNKNKEDVNRQTTLF